MVNIIDETGIHTDDFETILTDLKNGFMNIYGQDTNFESSTPDGQALNIFALAQKDMLDLMVQLYNNFNPETVVGRSQDNLYKLIGLYRKSSQYTFVKVNVTITEPVNLQGLDANLTQSDATGYTVSDTNGKKFILSNSVQLTEPGTYSLEFRAEQAGALQVLPNTIKNMVTVVRGVNAINNEDKEYLLGNAEETDYEFRLRFNKSRSIAGRGFEDSLLSALLNLNLVTDAHVLQNRTAEIDNDGTDPHCVWVIVEGASNNDIAQVIYANLTDGCGMRGDISVNIQKSNGLYETIRFDRPVDETLYIRANLKNLTDHSLNLNQIKQHLIETLSYRIYSPADCASITSQMRNESYIPYDVQISSDNQTWHEYLYPSSKKNRFVLSAANINLQVIS